MRKEMELFVGSVIHEDRSVMDLLNANYTFVNERLAKHYGMPNIYGSNFRRVELTPAFDMRRGLLGKGAIETMTAYPQRTRPTGSRQEDHADVPRRRAADAAARTYRSCRRCRMMLMATPNPPCASRWRCTARMSPARRCHKIMDPIGFSMENFDAIGRWRTTDEGKPIDPSGKLVDGTQARRRGRACAPLC